MQKIGNMLACSLVASVFSLPAEAFPSARAVQSADSVIVPVRRPCEAGFHKRPYGACMRSLAPTRLVVTPNEGPLWPRVYCPNFDDYYSERYGRCIPRR
jgi:hypothetical protein